MLAAGYAAAKYMAEQNINFPFTVQAEPDEEIEINDTLSSMYEARKNSKAGVIEFKPGLHSGLGLEPYSRVTSPLRRYADLLAHRQLKSLILGREPMGYEEMAEKMTYAENAAASRRKLEKYANEYYTIVYLANNPGYTTTATLVAKRNGQLVFLIPELAYEYKARLQGNYQIDKEYTLTLQLAEPSQQRCVFKVSGC
jgi:exoribonuclease-2